MAQLTAETVEDVLRWIETTPHHYGENDDRGRLTLKGYGDKLIIPADLRLKTMRLMEPAGQFDTRMFRATKSGRRRLRKVGA